VGGSNVVSKGLRFDCGFYAGEIINLASTTSDEVNFYGCQLAKFSDIQLGDNSTRIDEQDFIGCSVDNCGQFKLNFGTTCKWEDNTLGSPYEASTDGSVDTLAFNVVSAGQGRDTITRTTGSFIDDGWQPGMTVTITNADLGGNNTSHLIFDVVALTLTLAVGQDVTADASDANALLDLTVDGYVKLDFNPNTTNFRDTLIQSADRGILIDASGVYDMRAITFADNVFDLKTTHASGVVTYNVLEGGDTPTTDQDGAGTIVINNAVLVKVTALDNTATAIQNARVHLKADTGGDLPAEETVTITRSGSVATVTHATHGLTTGDEVVIRGANQPEYNGIFTITVNTASEYTYTVSGSPATPATGTIDSTALILNGLTSALGVVEDTGFNFTSDQPVTGHVRRATSSPLFKSAGLIGTITSAGFNVISTMESDE